jgi:hypothetical protein
MILDKTRSELCLETRNKPAFSILYTRFGSPDNMYSLITAERWMTEYRAPLAAGVHPAS